MTFETDFIGALNVSGVTSLVPLTRITANKRIQNGSLPAITFERITSNPVQSIAGDDTGLDQVRMRINCWADDYKEARQIRDAVRLAMRGLTSYFINDQDLYEDDTQIYRVAMDFYVWARVPILYNLTADGITVTPVLGAPEISAPWSPASLFLSGEDGAWYDPSDLSSLWQDSAGTVPVTAADQPVGRMSDKSGNGKHATQSTADARPVLRQSGGLYYLEVDPTDDAYSMSIALTQLTIALAVRYGANSTLSHLISDGSAQNDIRQRNSINDTLQYIGNNFLQNATAVNNTDRVIVGTCNATTAILRVNQNQASEARTPVSTTYNRLFSRTGTSQKWAGRFYGGVIRNVATTGTDLTNLEEYLAGKAGITL